MIKSARVRHCFWVSVHWLLS